MTRVSKKEVKEALEKAKEVEKSEDIYSIQKLQEEDSWFRQQGKRLVSLLGKVPVGIKKKETVKKTKKKIRKKK